MKIDDLDPETRKIIFLAHLVARDPTPEKLGRLATALLDFDKKHQQERENNLLTTLFSAPATERQP